MISDYKYTIKECAVPEVRRASLDEYRVFRRRCLEDMRGDADTSVMNQVSELAWRVAAFQTLNEARRLEPEREVNGLLWGFVTDGYASLVSLGVRKLVDDHKDTHSLWNVLSMMERRPELLTREKFVCYDGLPYDWQHVYGEYVASLQSKPDSVGYSYLPTDGPGAWDMSRLLHEAFDRLSGVSENNRRRSDKILLSVIQSLKERLRHVTIRNVCTLADRRIAHAERLTGKPDRIPNATHNDIMQALEEIVKVAHFVLGTLFYDTAWGSVVPTPQYNILEALDHPWATAASMPALHQYRHDVCAKMDTWLQDTAPIVAVTHHQDSATNEG